MSFSKLIHSLIIIVVLISSLWTWELLSFNVYLLLVILGLSILLYLSIIWSSKKILYIFCLILIPVLIVQWKTTNNASLNYMNLTDRYLFATRRKELSMSITNSERYLENKATYMFYKFEQNLLRHIDLNLYFFGGHPRERSGIREFEKFSFLFLPFFILGLLRLIEYFPGQLLVSLFIPLLGLSIIGHDNPIGPFSLFPFFSATIAVGLFFTIKKILKKKIIEDSY